MNNLRTVVERHLIKNEQLEKEKQEIAELSERVYDQLNQAGLDRIFIPEFGFWKKILCIGGEFGIFTESSNISLHNTVIILYYHYGKDIPLNYRDTSHKEKLKVLRYLTKNV